MGRHYLVETEEAVSVAPQNLLGQDGVTLTCRYHKFSKLALA